MKCKLNIIVKHAWSGPANSMKSCSMNTSIRKLSLYVIDKSCLVTEKSCWLVNKIIVWYNWMTGWLTEIRS